MPSSLRRRGLLTAVLATLTGAALLLPAAPAPAATAPVTPIPKLDVNRYLGTWKQLADIPQPYEALCVKNTTATYSLNKDGTVKVRNTCTGPLGVPIAITGAARILDPVRKSSLQVSFLTLGGKTAFVGSKPNYLVIGIAPDYSWAVVGDPGRNTAYLLSRTVTLSSAKLAAAKQVLVRNGYDLCALKITPQTGGATKKAPLC